MQNVILKQISNALKNAGYPVETELIYSKSEVDGKQFVKQTLVAPNGESRSVRSENENAFKLFKLLDTESLKIVVKEKDVEFYNDKNQQIIL